MFRELKIVKAAKSNELEESKILIKKIIKETTDHDYELVHTYKYHGLESCCEIVFTRFESNDTV